MLDNFGTIYIKEFKTVPFLKIGLFLNFANFVTKESKITSLKHIFQSFLLKKVD